MDYFLAKSNRQLGICLRMLYANGIQGHVETVLNSKMRIEFHITITEMNNLTSWMHAIESKFPKHHPKSKRSETWSFAFCRTVIY